MTKDQIKRAALHFLKLAALGAAIALIVGVSGALGALNPATLPASYATFAAMLIPLAVSALAKAKTEIEAELAAEEANNAIIAAHKEAAEAEAKAEKLAAQLNVPPAPTPIKPTTDGSATNVQPG